MLEHMLVLLVVLACLGVGAWIADTWGAAGAYWRGRSE